MSFQNLLLPPSFFQWCEATFIGHWIKYSRWDFAILETMHIIGITLLIGSTLVVDLRLLGVGNRTLSTKQLSDELEPWTRVALGFTIATGVPMFLSEAVRMGLNGPFLFKMILLIFALLIHFTIRRRAIRPGMEDGILFGRVVACLSLISWLSVALAGRAIAFFMTLNGSSPG